MSLSVEEFTSFIEYYKGKVDKKGNEFYDTAHEISKPCIKVKHNECIKKGNPLVNHSDYKFYSLDEMKHDCPLFNKFPSSVDGVIFRIINESPKLFLIEFKGGNLDKENVIDDEFEDLISLIKPKMNYNFFEESKLNRINKDIEEVRSKSSIDSLEISLEKKPRDSLDSVFPILYKYYLKRNGLNYEHALRDMRIFLEDCEVNYYIFRKPYKNKSDSETAKRKDKILYQLSSLQESERLNEIKFYFNNEFQCFLDEKIFDKGPCIDLSESQKEKYASVLNNC